MPNLPLVPVATRAALAAALIAGCGDNLAPEAPDAPPTPIDAPIDSPPSGDVPRAEPTACRFDVPSSLGAEGQAYACGDLTVWEDRVARGRTIRLHYIRFESTAASNNATIYLDGGPGGDGQNMVQFAAALGEPFLGGLKVDGDFLVLGQRGTSRSIPFLDCFEVDCSDLADQADVRQYNTAANADDVDDLRAALGYEKLNLYGISYGSRLGLEVLRRHGDNVRSAVIEGLVPAQVVWPAAVPASFNNALTELAESCTAHGECSTAYGNLRTKFSQGLVSLNNAPLSVTIQGSPFDLDGFTYTYLLFRLMYSKSSYPWLPLFISDVAARRTDRFDNFLEAAFGGGGGSATISMGLYNSVVCSELFNPPDPDAFDELNAGVPQSIVDQLGGSWFGLMDQCSQWPRAPASLQSQLNQPVTSAVRTLVSSGTIDPITPPGFGDIAAATLSNAEVVVHENSGHGATLQSPCGTANLHAFLADPAATHDLTCAASVGTAYVLPQSLAPRPYPVERMRAELGLAPVLPHLERRLHAKLRR